MNGLISFLSRGFRPRHPRIESLVSHADGKSTPEVREHLGRCERCHNIASALNAAIESRRQADAPSEGRIATLFEETYDILHARMSAWHSCGERTPAAQVREKWGRSRRLLAALECYFGEELARRVDRGTRWSAGDQLLVSSTKPFFAAFLGRSAADTLTREIAGAAR